MMFSIPAIDEFCRVLRAVITESGGSDQVFKQLTDEPDETIKKLAVTIGTQNVLRNIIEGNANLILNQAGNDEDRELLQAFWGAWEVWSELYPVQAHAAKLVTIPASDFLSMPIPKIVNDVFSCTSSISLETFTEEFIVSSVLKLSMPDKDIGGPNIFVMSGTVESFLDTIRLMLNSIRLRGTEVGLFKIPADREITESILNRLDRIRTMAETLKTQFENMK